MGKLGKDGHKLCSQLKMLQAATGVIVGVASRGGWEPNASMAAENRGSTELSQWRGTTFEERNKKIGMRNA